MQKDVTSVLAYNLDNHSKAVELMDLFFRKPANKSLCGKNGKVAWEHFLSAGRKVFGEQPYFHSEEQFQAAMEYPDKALADRCDSLRSDPKGNIVSIGTDSKGLLWGTNFTHFTYKSAIFGTTMSAFAKSLLGFSKCNKQSHFFYYPQGAYREWHTNEGSLYPGWRVYFVKASEAGKSFFNYVDGDRVVSVPDDRYGIRIFRFGGGLKFYHSVCAKETDRWSFGVGPTDWPFDTIAEAKQFLDEQFHALPA